MSNADQIPQSLGDQHAAAAVPPERPIELDMELEDELDTAADTAEQESEEAEAVEDTYLGVVSAMVVVNLNYSDSDLYAGLKSFKLIPTEAGAFNAYNPFKRESAEDPTSGEGLARAPIGKAIELAAELNDKNIAFLSSSHEIRSHLEGYLARMLKVIEQSFPLPMEGLIGSVETSDPDDEEEAITLPFLMKDIIKVSGWITESQPHADSTDVEFNVVLSFTVNASMLYDTADPQKYILFTQSALDKLRTTNGATVPVVYGVTVDYAELEAEAFRDLIGLLFSDTEKYGFSQIKRSTLLANGLEPSLTWAPQSEAVVTKNFLPARGDAFIGKFL
jgi:hypothetical protein